MLNWYITLLLVLLLLFSFNKTDIFTEDLGLLFHSHIRCAFPVCKHHCIHLHWTESQWKCTHTTVHTWHTKFESSHCSPGSITPLPHLPGVTYVQYTHAYIQFCTRVKRNKHSKILYVHRKHTHIALTTFKEAGWVTTITTEYVPEHVFLLWWIHRHTYYISHEGASYQIHLHRGVI